jgi:hypothetical protein
VLLLLLGAGVMALTDDPTLLAIAAGGPIATLLFRYVLDLPDEL